MGIERKILKLTATKQHSNDSIIFDVLLYKIYMNIKNFRDQCQLAVLKSTMNCSLYDKVVKSSTQITDIQLAYIQG